MGSIPTSPYKQQTEVNETESDTHLDEELKAMIENLDQAFANWERSSDKKDFKRIVEKVFEKTLVNLFDKHGVDFNYFNVIKNRVAKIWKRNPKLNYKIVERIDNFKQWIVHKKKTHPDTNEIRDMLQKIDKLMLDLVIVTIEPDLTPWYTIKYRKRYKKQTVRSKS